MLTQEDDVEIHALARRGWSKSAIARHTGRDRKTVAKYLAGNGPAREPQPSCLEPYRAYLEARFVDDPHLRGSVLFVELGSLGFDRSYPTLVREIRELGLRPVCDCCKAGGVKVTVGLEHEPGDELQLDWLELTETPWGEKAYVLVGALSHSGRVRGVFADGQTFAHLIEALDGVLRRLGGTARSWRTDRMATVVYPGSDRLRSEAAAAAKHYGVTVAVCPANRPQRKGVVEKAIDYVTQSWWRAAPVSTPAEAQADLDRWCVAVSDRRRRGTSTVGQLAATEPLLALPELAFPAEHQAERVVADDALVAFESNRYSVAPSYASQTVTVRARLGDMHLEIYSQAGRRIARHRRAPNGAGQIVRSPEHAKLLEQAVLGAFTTQKACPRKPNRPPGERALAEAARLRGQAPGAVVVDLDQYARIAKVAGQR
ncbi:MAG: IS21/IS408/IS1162 family transposase [Solirubrobacteraceae bacterium]